MGRWTSRPQPAPEAKGAGERDRVLVEGAMGGCEVLVDRRGRTYRKEELEKQEGS